ncbi:MAG TPA: DUF2163 domain-containing protein [Roseiarcus sp.]|nr:DUF2163 domain-containing protein [Roseiarcus sp.]
MKSASAALIALLNTARSQPDSPIVFAECFTFTLSTGVAYAWTNADFPVSYGGFTYLASGPLVQGLKYRASVGLDVDRQQITIAARPTDLINGAPFLVAVRDGAFDGAMVQRDRVFMNSPGGAVVGGVTLFKGRISTVDQVGRTTAQVTVASDLVILDYEMPRNLFSTTCVHTLYDSGCGVIRGTYAAAGTAGAGSNQSTINSPVALAMHAQGSLVFSTGLNANVRATVKAAYPGQGFALMYPLPFAPAFGDAFTVYAGCDRTLATCQGRFNNKANFRGFPFVPPAETAV